MGMANEADAIRKAREQAYLLARNEADAALIENRALKDRVEIGARQKALALQSLDAAKATLTRGAAALEYVNLAIEALGG